MTVRDSPAATVVSSREPSDPRPVLPVAWTAVVGVVVSGAAGAALVGGPVFNLGFTALSTLSVLVLVSRHRVVDAIHVCLWLWLTVPLMRRMSDLASGFDSSNPVLAAPALSSMALLVVLLRPEFYRTPAPGFAFFVFWVFSVTGGVSFIVGAANAGVVPAGVTLLQWFGPLALGVAALSVDPPEELLAMLRSFSLVALLVLGAYGVYQWVVAPEWDAAWLLAVTPTSDYFGRPDPFKIRVYSSMNSPFVFGVTMVWLIIAQLTAVGRRGFVRWLAVGVGCIALGLSEVRAAWIFLALCLILLFAFRRLPVGRLTVGAVVLYGSLTLFFQTALETVSGRFDSLSSGGSDESLLARLVIYGDVLGPAMSAVVGAGFGSTGSGARASGGDAAAQFGNLDSTYLDILRTAGSVLGTICIVSLITAAVVLGTRIGRTSGVATAATVFLLGAPIVMLLGNVVSGPGAVLTFLSLAVGARARYDRSSTADQSSELMTRSLRSNES